MLNMVLLTCQGGEVNVWDVFDQMLQTHLEMQVNLAFRESFAHFKMDELGMWA